MWGLTAPAGSTPIGVMLTSKAVERSGSKDEHAWWIINRHPSAVTATNALLKGFRAAADSLLDLP